MASGSPDKQGLVLRNTLILVGARLAGVPLTILVSALMGRYLGAGEFGYAYLAGTLAVFGFLLVDWGHSTVLPSEVARDPARAGAFLGTSLVWRLAAAVIVYFALALVCALLAYPPEFQLVLALIMVQYFFGCISAACQDVIRGFERTDVTAYAQVGGQVLAALLVVPTLLLGGKLVSVMIVQAIGSGLVMLAVWRTTRRIGVGRLTFDRAALKVLFNTGWSLLILNFAMTLQSNIDALFLSKLATPDAIGWHAAAQRLMGVLMLPATALITALYPTLARLYMQDIEQYRLTTRRAIYGTTQLAIPMALCCALYRDVGIQIFSKEQFGPASENLLVLSVLAFLLYFSMPIGTAILAAGRMRRFAAAQSLCIVVSLALDPLLIPWFQTHYGNGGLGVCVAGVVSEILMVGAALLIAPKGILDRSLFMVLAKGAVAGAAMAGVAFLLRDITPYAAAPVAVLAYIACLWLVGGVQRADLVVLRHAVARKFHRQQA